jgi:hypothetical protein
MSRPGPVRKPPTAKFYRIIEEIYELEYEGQVPLTPVIFKCHWFDHG